MWLLQGLGFSGFFVGWRGKWDCRGVSDGVLRVGLMSVGEFRKAELVRGIGWMEPDWSGDCSKRAPASGFNSSVNSLIW